jgi:hypothetical protein
MQCQPRSAEVKQGFKTKALMCETGMVTYHKQHAGIQCSLLILKHERKLRTARGNLSEQCLLDPDKPGYVPLSLGSPRPNCSMLVAMSRIVYFLQRPQIDAQLPCGFAVVD